MEHTLTVILSVLLAGYSVWCLFKPHRNQLGESPGLATDASVDGYTDQKERLFQVLKDLELDFSTGKLSAEEYRAMKAQLHGETAEVLKALDRLHAKQ